MRKFTRLPSVRRDAERPAWEARMSEQYGMPVHMLNSSGGVLAAQPSYLIGTVRAFTPSPFSIGAAR